MKYIKLFEELITEIGDASAKSFKWKQTEGDTAKKFTGNDSSDLIYKFTTDKKTEYMVSIDVEPWMRGSDGPGIRAEVNFAAGTKGGGYRLDDTNRGEQYRVMATIKDIMFSFIEEWQDHWYIHDIEISPVKSEGDDRSDNDSTDLTDTRRGKLYGAYLKKQVKKLSKPYIVRVFNDYFLIQSKFPNPFQ